MNTATLNQRPARRSCILSLAILCLMAGQTQIGATGLNPFQVLNLDTDVRASALGNGGAAVADPEAPLHYNPAGLSALKTHSASFMHGQYFQGIRQESMALSLKRGFGLDFSYLSYGNDLSRTTLNSPDGTGETFGASEWVTTFGYGYALGKKFSVGLAAKYVRGSIDDYSAGSFAMDMGTLYKVPQTKLNVGFTVQNLGPSVKFASRKESLPLTFKTGLQYKIINDSLLLAGSLSIQRNEAPLFSCSTEYPLANNFDLRAGYSGRGGASGGLTAGIGMRFNAVQLDYAFLPVSDLGYSHQIGVTWKFGKGTVK